MAIPEYNMGKLRSFLRDKPLDDFTRRSRCKSEAEYRAQAPSIHPLGKLKHNGVNGMGERWITLDGKTAVTISYKGIVDGINDNN